MHIYWARLLPEIQCNFYTVYVGLYVYLGKAPTNGTVLEENAQDENKPLLKLIMDPRGQVQDISTMRRQGFNIEPAALSPDVCMQIVNDLNSPKGKGNISNVQNGIVCCI